MTILLILVWNVSVNIAFMVLHAVHFHFKHCGIGFLKLVSSLDYQWNCLSLHTGSFYHLSLLSDRLKDMTNYGLLLTHIYLSLVLSPLFILCLVCHIVTIAWLKWLKKQILGNVLSANINFYFVKLPNICIDMSQRVSVGTQPET